MPDPAITDAEFLQPEDICRIQQQRWREQAAHIEARSEFYRQRNRGKPLPRSLDAFDE